ncbi:GerAB/ArcD/ProY family transporter [Ornithinibacillus californiensis]|uniref:GerAB/ArcD/ProY family transporter n=1 Tax=Ornithinibacillus californiensis TaxID=161536 RepID=UPI00064D8345|nr:endospore germination permease [Ornithinibacillus californiensis]
MEQSKQLIGIKEYVAIALLMIGTKLTDDTPSIIFENVKNAGWMTPIINGLIAIIPIYFLMKVVTNYKSKNLAEVTDHLFGKFFSFLILLLLLAVGLSAVIIDTAIYTDIIGTMYFSKTPTIIIYGILMFVCAYGASRGFEQIGSVAWIVFPYLQGSLLLALILTIGQGNTAFLFPLFGPGTWEVVKESSLKLSIYADFLYLFLFYPYIKNSKVFKKGTWLSFILIVINMSISMACYVFLFDYQSIMQLNYPYHEVIRTITFGFMINMEALFLPFWLIASFVRFSIYLYVIAILFGHLFKIKHFEYLIPSLATSIVFLGMIPESPTFAIFNLRENLILIVSPLFFFLPCLMWLVAKLKGEYKNANKKKVG